MPVARHLPSGRRGAVISDGMRIEGSSAIFHPGSQMRVRITKTLKGSIDGIQLSRLVQGQVYDVNTSLACYLLSEEMAEPANGESCAALPKKKKSVEQRTADTRGATLGPQSLAADRSHRKRNDHS